MTEGLEAVTSAALGIALDAASLRQQAFAANIANAGSVGYQPVQVNFESQLEDARRELESGRQLNARSLSNLQPVLEQVGLDAAGLPPKVMLDMEVAGMAQNAVHYQSLIKALSKHYAMLSTAVSDGRK